MCVWQQEGFSLLIWCCLGWKTTRGKLQGIWPRIETKWRSVWESKNLLMTRQRTQQGQTFKKSESLLFTEFFRDAPSVSAQLEKSSSLEEESLARSAEVASILECPVCLDTMVGVRIYQCRNGHNVCERCSANPSLVTCPQCREPYRWVWHQAEVSFDQIQTPTNIDTWSIIQEHQSKKPRTGTACQFTRDSNQNNGEIKKKWKLWISRWEMIIFTCQMK